MAEPPKLLPIRFGSKKFLEGEMAQASCILKKGDLPVEFVWELDYEMLKSAFEITILNVERTKSILTINPVRTFHQGRYSCLAINAFGRDEVWTTLEVDGM